MPGEPPDPGVVQSFLDGCTVGSWSSRHNGIITGGSLHFPQVVTSATWPTVGQWALGGTGVQISHAVFSTCQGGTAQADGSFLDANGGSHYLASVNGWAVLA